MSYIPQLQLAWSALTLQKNKSWRTAITVQGLRNVFGTEQGGWGATIVDFVSWVYHLFVLNICRFLFIDIMHYELVLFILRLIGNVFIYFSRIKFYIFASSLIVYWYIL